VDTGKDVKGWKVGDRMSVETRTGSCGFAISVKAVSPRSVNRRGPWVLESRAFQKYVAGPARLLHRLPDNISLRRSSDGAYGDLHYIDSERLSTSGGNRYSLQGRRPIGLISLMISKSSRSEDGSDNRTSADEGLRFQKARELGADFTISVAKRILSKRF